MQRKAYNSILSLDAKDALSIWGENIKMARKVRKLSQVALAERAAMDIKTYRKVELGDPAVSVGAFIAVMDMLDLLIGLEQLCAPHNDSVGRSIRARER